MQSWFHGAYMMQMMMGDFDPTTRYIEYNVYNVGDETVRPSSRWSVSYVYYNAYDAEDYGIILYDYYTDEYGFPGENGPLTSGGLGLSGNWWNNVELPPFSGLAEEIVGGEYFTWTYQTPNLNGYYYLVLIADTFDDIPEQDESNNLFFLTNQSGGPILFENGVPIGLKDNKEEIRSVGKPQRGQQMMKPHEVSQDYSNAYTPAEIKKLIQHDKSTGELADKVAGYVNDQRNRKQ
jgi:hypothetical protein